MYAIGDVISIPLADGKPLPKAGVFAEAQAKVVAARTTSRLTGEAPTAAYDGSGYCFLEVGHEEAMLVSGNFLAEPHPDVQLTEPAAEHFEAKVELERSRLSEWFSA